MQTKKDICITKICVERYIYNFLWATFILINKTFTCSRTNLETIKIGYNITKKEQLSIDKHSLIEQV